jgi:KaiC/GvpD/RAD55 family RecA-like ATPase
MSSEAPLAPFAINPDILRIRAAPPIAAVDPRVPTGVADFDTFAGGFPVGSVVLLTGDPGAGHQEFALTSSAHLMFHQDEPRLQRFYLGGARGSFVYPTGIGYVSMTRSREQVLREIISSFEPTYGEVLARHIRFFDLSQAYFADTVVPSAWAQLPSSLLSARPRETTSGPLAAVAQAFEEAGPGNVVIVDSLTDLLTRPGLEPGELVTLVKGLRRKSKEWGGIVYLILSRGVASHSTEEALIDSVDGVLSFSWSSAPMRSTRSRVMIIAKSLPVLAHTPHEHQGRFVIRVSAMTGLVTTQYERV